MICTKVSYAWCNQGDPLAIAKRVGATPTNLLWHMQLVNKMNTYKKISFFLFVAARLEIFAYKPPDGAAVPPVNLFAEEREVTWDQ